MDGCPVQIRVTEEEDERKFNRFQGYHSELQSGHYMKTWKV
jgi:hypothetical protein